MVFFHELGHFATARKFGVKCDEFGFGLPPRLCGWKKINGRWKFFWGNKNIDEIKSEKTVWSINWIPLGGFVKIKGENGEDQNASDSFVCKKIWQRLLIISAGVIMNVILVFVCLSVVYMIGAPAPVDEGTAGSNIQIMNVLSGSPAEKAGLQVGDIIVSLNEKKFAKISDLQAFTSQPQNQVVSIIINRFGEDMTLSAKTDKMPDSEVYGLGVSLVNSGTIKYPWYEAIWQGLLATGFMFWAIISGFVHLFVNLFQHQPIGVDLAGPIGIAAMTGQVAKLGFVYILNFMALLSMNLAIINFLPFPALDGGRVLFLLVEKIRGKAANEKVERIVHTAGFFLLMTLFVFVTGKDLFKYKDSFINIWNNLIH